MTPAEKLPPCQRCGGPTYVDANLEVEGDGGSDLACVLCGWRQVPAALARTLELERQRNRQPGTGPRHGGIDL